MLQILQEGESPISKLEKVETRETERKLWSERKKGIQHCDKVSGYQILKEGAINCLRKKQKAIKDTVDELLNLKVDHLMKRFVPFLSVQNHFVTIF